MKFLFFLLVIVFSNFGNSQGQTVRRATLLQFRAYMIDVVSATAQGLEDYQWCNLKIPEFSEEINTLLFGRYIKGRVTYKNGYVVTIQHLDIVQSSVQQVWTFNQNQGVAQVDVRAQLRLHDVKLGFDVVAEIDGQDYRFTSTFTHRLISFNFSILKNMKTNEIQVTVTGVDPRSSGRMSFLPSNKQSDIFANLFRPAQTVPGVLSWGPEVIQPIASDVVINKVPFPDACYNCPL